MTQPVEAVGGETAPVESNPTEVFENLAKDVFGIEDDPEEEPTPVEGEPTEDSAEETEDDTAIEEEADDLPPIEAPVSWDAEAKDVFKTLPREAQEIVQKREAEREKFVQAKSQEAAQAKQTAAQQAQAELAQLNAQYAQQLQTIAASIQAEEPDPMLQVTDPVAYAQQMRTYRQAEAQRQQAQHTAFQHAQQAQSLAQQAEQQHIAEQHRIIVENFPEYADPTTGPELQRKLSAVAKRLGYSDELIQSARATDILAMRTVADAFDKADKYDALQKTKMQKVREAKGKPPVSARPGVAQTGDQLRAQSANAALETVLTSKNREVQGAAFYELAKKSGWVS
jgi:hypothetical protein